MLVNFIKIWFILFSFVAEFLQVGTENLSMIDAIESSRFIISALIVLLSEGMVFQFFLNEDYKCFGLGLMNMENIACSDKNKKLLSKKKVKK